MAIPGLYETHASANEGACARPLRDSNRATGANPRRGHVP